MTTNAFPHQFTPAPNALDRWGFKAFLWLTGLSMVAILLMVGVEGKALQPSALSIAFGVTANLLLLGGLGVMIYGMIIEPNRQRKIKQDYVSQWVTALRASGCSRESLVVELAKIGGARIYPQGQAIEQVLDEDHPGWDEKTAPSSSTSFS